MLLQGGLRWLGVNLWWSGRQSFYHFSVTWWSKWHSPLWERFPYTFFAFPSNGKSSRTQQKRPLRRPRHRYCVGRRRCWNSAIPTPAPSFMRRPSSQLARGSSPAFAARLASANSLWEGWGGVGGWGGVRGDVVSRALWEQVVPAVSKNWVRQWKTKRWRSLVGPTVSLIQREEN